MDTCQLKGAQPEQLCPNLQTAIVAANQLAVERGWVTILVFNADGQFGVQEAATYPKTIEAKRRILLVTCGLRADVTTYFHEAVGMDGLFVEPKATAKEVTDSDN